MKIQNKLLSIYIIAGLIPMLMVIFYLTQSTRTMLKERASDEAVASTYRIEERIRQIIKISVSISDGLYIDRELNQIITKNYEKEFDMIHDYMNYKAFDNYLRLYTEIDSIRLYVDKEKILNSSQIIPATEAIKQSEWYTQAFTDQGRIRLIYKKDEISREKHLCLVRLVKSEQNQVLGVLVININNRFTDKIIKDELFETIATIDENTVFLAKDTTLEGVIYNAEDTLYNIQPNHGIKLNAKYKDKKSLLIIDTFQPEKANTPIKIITIVPIENIEKDANQQFILSAWITVISLIISILLIFMFTRMLSKRLIIFRKEMDKVVHGDFEIIKELESEDEIGSLYKDLQIMIESIRLLIHENYESKINQEQMHMRQREVEFKMLASQINPHFLYNTLETIRMRAYLSGEIEIAEVVKKIAKIMRRNLEVSNQLVPLDSEVDLVKNYLEIQKFRFGEKITFEIHMLGDLSGYVIVPLLLQPLVENAFIHGLESKETSGTIVITLEETDAFLKITVTDDGVGIPEEKLKEIMDILNNFKLGRRKGIGLSNVNQRIKLFYGEQYSLDIQSELGKGTQFILYLPLKKEAK